MAKYNRRVSDGYGITQPIPGIFPEPIEALRNPTTADRAELGQVWINTVVPNAWICVLNAGGLTTWILCAPGTSNVNTINSLAPFGGNITIAGTADQILAISAGSTVTLSLTGPYSPSTYTNHGVLIGEGTTAIHATSAGIAGQVLTSNGPLLDPTFQTAGGGLLNTINSLVPVGGDILLAGTANQITATSAGHTVTYSLPAAITAPGSLTTTTSLTATLGAITATNGNLVFGTAGNKILSTSVGTLAAAGANSFGSVVLVGGTATVATTAVTANSLIVIWRQSIGATGAAAIGHLTVGTITAATSFVIRSVSAADATALVVTDVSVVGYMIIN
jgi:hypothetical protein